MKRRTHTARLAAVAAATALVLAACGSEETDSGSSGEEEESLPEGNGTLVIGSLLPSTGDLAFLGPPEFAGVDLAIEEINAAGGVLGQDVVGEDADSGDGTPKIAPGSVDKLLSAEADAIVGAASSSVSLSVIDKIVEAGVVQFSPANTSTAFDDYEDDNLYFRTAPSDVLQGNVMGNLVMEDGASNVAILARQDAYGEVLADQVDETISGQGGNVVSNNLYAVDATSYTSEIQEIADADPDAVVLIGFDETKKIIPALQSGGVGPKDVSMYFVDGNTADYSEDFPAGTLTGVKGTLPGAELQDDFRERLLEVDPDLDEFAYAPESYDAAITIALAAVAADNDSGEAIASQIVDVTREGEECTTFEDCVALLEDGEDIDYNGVSGPIDMTDTGSPSKATIGVYEYKKDNSFEGVDFIAGVVE